MARLTILALCTLGLSGLAQASQVNACGNAHIEILDENRDYQCKAKIDNDELQALIPEKYIAQKSCGMPIRIVNTKNQREIKAKIVGFCNEEECEGNDILVSPEAYAKLGASHKPAPPVTWEF